MPKWLKLTLGVFAVLFAVAGAAYYWFVVESSMPSDAEYAFDIRDVRRAIGSTPGDRPERIELERVAAFSFPATAIVAGDGWSQREMPVYSFRLVYPDKSIIIDTALDAELGGDNLVAFDEEAYARMNRAMEEASLIVITHEHMDHIGGLTVHPNLAAILPNAQLTERQLSEPARSLPARFEEGVLDGFEPLAYEGFTVIAPGVALIAAAAPGPRRPQVDLHVKK